MIYNEIIGNLFDYEGVYTLVHCISADFALGAGIAVQFNQHYDMRNILNTKYAYLKGLYPTCILTNNVFNLVTKEHYWNKPTYGSLKDTLNKMKQACLSFGIKRLAMPTIGCGLDGLDWDKVSNIIQEVFEDTDIEILVVKL